MTCPTPPLPVGHDDLRMGLMERGRALRASADDPAAFPPAREELARFCTERLLPHLERDEAWLLEVEGFAEGRLLAIAMRVEARAMTAAAYEVLGATETCEAVAATRVLHSLLAAHAHHEDLLTSATGHRVVQG